MTVLTISQTFLRNPINKWYFGASLDLPIDMYANPAKLTLLFTG